MTYKVELLRREDYSGEHREWTETYELPATLVDQIIRENTVPGTKPTHVYIAFARVKRRFWFGYTLKVCHVTSSRELLAEWFRAAMANKAKSLPPRRYGHELHDHYRWCSMSLDSPYGSGCTGWPANASDIFHDPNRRNYD